LVPKGIHFVVGLTLFSDPHATSLEEIILIRELIDMEVEAVVGGVSDLGKYITKAIDDALSAAIGGNTGIVPPGMPGHYQPYHSNAFPQDV
jgi:hypothetical protein